MTTIEARNLKVGMTINHKNMELVVLKLNTKVYQDGEVEIEADMSENGVSVWFTLSMAPSQQIDVIKDLGEYIENQIEKLENHLTKKLK